MRAFIFILVMSFVFLNSTLVQAEGDTPVVGRKSAQRFFEKEVAPKNDPSEHLLMLHLGTYTSTEVWNWCCQIDRQDNVKANFLGLTYRMGEWTSTMDNNLRIEFITYEIEEYRPQKISFTDLVTFPDAAAKFPLYFGLGLGVGVFLKQVPARSALSADFQLVAGGRWINAAGRTGFFIEAGLKNHINVLSAGQFNGVFLAGGAVFSF